MIVLKFEKTSTSALAAHVDTLRAVTYVLRRANLAVEYSQGYNPHMELAFSPPIALGVESLCEYVSVKAEYSPDLLDMLNKVCPQGLKFTAVYNCNVNLAAKINSATYRVECNGIGQCCEQITASDFCIEYIEKGVKVTKNVANRIYSAQQVNDNCIFVTLAVGNDNLRPDRLVCHLINVNNLVGDYSITKTCSYVDGKPADQWLNNVG